MHGFWNQKPQILGTWTFWVTLGGNVCRFWLIGNMIRAQAQKPTEQKQRSMPLNSMVLYSEGALARSGGLQAAKKAKLDPSRP